MDSKSTEAQDLCQRFEKLKSSRSTWDAYWQDIANYVMPRKAEITERSYGQPSSAKFDRLFDATAIRANETLASGIVSLMSPAEARWFAYGPPAFLKGDDAVENWFAECTQIAQEELAKSNFYTAIHELHLDRGCFGTAAMYCQEGRRSALSFTKFDVGSFCLAENDEGIVDTLFREFRMTLRQMREKFGEENLSRKLQEKLKKEKCIDEEVTVLHAIYPRDPDDIDPKMADARNKPIASCYIEMDAKHLMQEGGYMELPFFATRYLKWGSQVYGMSPSWMALPDARQVNFLEKQMDALAEIKAFPRILLPDSLEGTVDMTAGGATFFDPNNPNAVPREWATQGDYNVGLDRVSRKEKAINEAFHVDFFQMFAQIDKQMTAREVMERSNEKLLHFSATATLLTTEVFNPLLQRVFGILARLGAFPPPPDAFVQMGQVPEPKISYNSRVALALKAMENQAFIRHAEIMMPLWQSRPETMDNYDFDEIARDMARNDGFPARWLVATENIEKMRQQRSEAAAKQQQMQEKMAMAEIAAKGGSVKMDSVAAQAAMAMQSQ